MDRTQTPSDLVARRVRELRGTMTVAQLAARCADLGAPSLTAQTLYKLESQRDPAKRRPRPVSVDELLVLALALGVAPVHLLVGLDDDAPYPVTPTMTERAELARQWVKGLHPLPGTSRQRYYGYAPERELERNAEVARMIEVRPDLFQVNTDTEDSDGEHH